MKLKAATSTPSAQLYYVVNQILYALVQGCESKDAKIIKVCTIRYHKAQQKQIIRP